MSDSVAAGSSPFTEHQVLPADMLFEQAADGAIRARSPHPLGPYPARITDCLERWAAAAPDRTFLAERDGHGQWRRLTYADALGRVRHLAQAFIERGLSADRTVVILSGNSIEHALVALAAMYCGVPYAPVAPVYSLAVREFTTLRAIVETMRPALVFADDGPRFERALDAVAAPGVEIVTSDVARGSRGELPSHAWSTTRTRAWGRRRWPRSCSRRDRPASPRASSTRTGCSAPTRSRCAP